MKRLITLLIIGLLTANSFAQSAKKSFEYAAKYEASKDYKKALYWYHEGMLKGKVANYTEGRSEYYRVLEKYVASSFSTPATSKENLLQRTAELDSLYKSRSSDFKSNPELKDKFNLKAAELSTYAADVRQDYKNKLNRSNQSADTKYASEIYSEAIAFYKKASSYPFIDKESFEKDFWTPELRTLEGAVSGKIMKANCEEAFRVLEASRTQYASKNYRKAITDLTLIMDWGKSIPQNKCDAIQKADELLKKAMKEGQARVIVMPVKSNNGIFSDLSNSLTDMLNMYEDPLLDALQKVEYENELFKNQIDMEEVYNLNPVTLAKLNKELSIRYIIMPRLVTMREGQPQYRRIPGTAHEVWYEEETTSSGDRIKKWYTKGSATYQQVNGDKRWDITLEFKIYDTMKKTIVFSRSESYNHISNVEYYEGNFDPEGYSDYSLPYSQRRTILSGLDSGSDKWRANFYNDKNFEDTYTVFDQCQEFMETKLIAGIYKAMGGKTE